MVDVSVPEDEVTVNDVLTTLADIRSDPVVPPGVIVPTLIFVPACIAAAAGEPDTVTAPATSVAVPLTGA